jgi:hypothetical protein
VDWKSRRQHRPREQHHGTIVSYQWNFGDGYTSLSTINAAGGKKVQATVRITDWELNPISHAAVNGQ